MHSNLLERVYFSGDATGTVKVIRTQRPVSLIVASVRTGGVDIYFGGSGVADRLAPDLHFGQSNQPVWLPLPLGICELTFVAVGPPTVTAAILLGGP